MSAVVPGVMNIDCIVGFVIADANDSMTFQLKHHRPAGIDLRFVLSKGKPPGNDIICLLAITSCYRVTPGFVKKFYPVSPIIIVNAIIFHFTAGQRIRNGVISVERGPPIIIVPGLLTGFHIITNRIPPGVLCPTACNIWVTGLTAVLNPIIVNGASRGPAVNTFMGSG